MNCREFVEFLIDYLDEQLPEAQRATFDTHMAACPGCVTFLETYRDTIRLGKCICGDLEGTVPSDVPEPLVAAILAARSSRS